MTSKNLDLNLLPIAFALFDQLSVSRAARLLGMSQPSVSMALRRLRHVFDDPLFVRVPGGMAPTPRAHEIVQAARPLLTRLQQELLAGHSFAPSTSTSEFTFALSDVGEMAFLPLLLGPLRSLAPHCAIRSVSMPPGEVAHGLEQGQVDVAVGYLPSLASNKLRHVHLSTHRFACLLRADHPARAERISAADFLAAEHMVVREDGRSQEVVERFFARRRVREHVAIRASHFLGVPFVVARSDLIATVPYAVARDFAAMSPQLAVALPPFEMPGFDLKLYWHRRFDNEPRNRWLRDQLIGLFRDDRRVTTPRDVSVRSAPNRQPAFQR